MTLFGIRQLGTLMCVRLSDRDPSDVEWKDLVGGLEKKLGEFDRMLLWSAGGNLSTKRRREMIEIVNRGRFKGVLWSDTTAVRGAGTAIGWDTDGAIKGVGSLDKAREVLKMTAREVEFVQIWLFGDLEDSEVDRPAWRRRRQA